MKDMAPQRTHRNWSAAGLVMARAGQVVLWFAFGYGVIGAILAVYVADTLGRSSMLRVGAVLVMLAGVAAAGIAQSQRQSTHH